MEMAAIDFIYFDMGKVIFEFDHDIACRKIGELTGTSAGEMKSIIFESGLEDRYETGLLNSDQFYNEFLKAAGVEIGKDDFLNAIADVFWPNQSIFPLIAQLRAQNFPIGLLSNTCKAHFEFICERYLIMRDFFSPVIVSYEVNSMKPDSKIYEKALEQAGCHISNCFFVDDKQENVDGAIAAGMDAVLYRSVPELVEDLIKRGVVINF